VRAIAAMGRWFVRSKGVEGPGGGAMTSGVRRFAVGTVGAVGTILSIYLKYLSISWLPLSPHRHRRVGTGGNRGAWVLPGGAIRIRQLWACPCESQRHRAPWHGSRGRAAWVAVVTRSAWPSPETGTILPQPPAKTRASVAPSPLGAGGRAGADTIPRVASRIEWKWRRCRLVYHRPAARAGSRTLRTACA
jgi:hypothetical protein